MTGVQSNLTPNFSSDLSAQNEIRADSIISYEYKYGETDWNGYCAKKYRDTSMQK